MDNSRFGDEETIPLLQNEDCADYNTLDTSRVDETFTKLDGTETTSTLHLRQKVKWDKITALYRHLNVTGDPGLADLDQFMIKKIQKQVTLMVFDVKLWQSLTNKHASKFLAAKALGEKFDGLISIWVVGGGGSKFTP